MMTAEGPANASGLRAGGVLVRSPFRGVLYPARLATMPFFGAKEFATAAASEEYCPVPVLMAPSQRYDLLSMLVSDARRQMPELQVFLVRLCGPDFGTQLTSVLLAADVLCTYDPEAMVPRLRAAGRTRILSIWQDLRVDSFAAGDNSLSVAVHDPADIPAFHAYVQDSPVLQSLAGFAITPVTDSDYLRPRRAAAS
jgi:hypothetical protein